MDNILDMSAELARKSAIAKDISGLLANVDPKVDAIGEVNPANYPPEIAQFRLNFLKRIIQLSDNLKLYYVDMLETFFRNLARQHGTINVVELWNDITKNTIPPNMTIDFSALLPEQKTLGLAAPKCAATGIVIKK